jgi:hypothetical protein
MAKKHTLFLDNGRPIRVTPSELKSLGRGLYFRRVRIYSTVTLLDDGKRIRVRRNG